jgi:D-alanyl-D-alanine carboxypeptidase
MTRSRFGAFVVAATLGALVLPASAQEPAFASDLQPRLDDAVELGAVGALAEVVDGDEVWRGTSGASELGSITKAFVATVVLQLVAEGRLHLTHPVDRWLPGVVPDGRRITIRHLPT